MLATRGARNRVVGHAHANDGLKRLATRTAFILVDRHTETLPQLSLYRKPFHAGDFYLTHTPWRFDSGGISDFLPNQRPRDGRRDGNATTL